jgi:hypothetical protein
MDMDAAGGGRRAYFALGRTSGGEKGFLKLTSSIGLLLSRAQRIRELGKLT